MSLNADGVRRLWEGKKMLGRVIREETAATAVEIEARIGAENERIRGRIEVHWPNLALSRRGDDPLA